MTTPDVQPYVTWQQALYVGRSEVRNLKQITIEESSGVGKTRCIARFTCDWTADVGWQHLLHSPPTCIF